MNRADRRRLEKQAKAAGHPLALLQDATHSLRRGQLPEAERRCRAFLRKEPANPQGLHLLDLVCHQSGRSAEAAQLIADAERLAPTDPEIPYNLGNSLLSEGRYAQAAEAFERALALRPGRPDALNNLGNALLRLNRPDDAIAAYRAALGAETGRAESLSNLAHALQLQGRYEEATDAYRQVLAYTPHHATARHMVAAMSGETPAAAPDDFIRRLFDNYAERFEGHLTTALNYDPSRFVTVLRRAAGMERRFAHALDLGCGTGLGGALLRPFVDRLTGIDLSSAMIAQAETKQIYDTLSTERIDTFLERNAGRFDLFFATDVFIYVGALESVFAKAAARASPGAWFAFSAERHDGEGFVLRSTGRYAHSLGYLTQTMAQAGWELRAEEAQTVRVENGVAISAYAVAAQLR